MEIVTIELAYIVCAYESGTEDNQGVEWEMSRVKG